MASKYVLKYWQSDPSNILYNIVFSREKRPFGATGSNIRELALKMVLIRRGSVDWQINGQLYHVSEGDVLLMSGGKQRRLQLVTDPQGLVYEYLRFMPMLLYPDIELAETMFIRSRGGDVIKSDTDTAKYIESTFNDIIRDTEAENGYTAVTVKARIILMLATLAGSAKKASNATGICSPSDYKLISDAVDYIYAHSSEHCTEKEIAAHFYVSPYYFSRLFQSCMGTGFSDFVRRVRIENTLNRLRKESRNGMRINILDAALDAGFGSSAGFYKAVKEIYGKTPKDLL